MTTERCSSYPCCGRAVTVAAAVAVVAVLISLATAATAYRVSNDLAGNYCASRRGGCCDGRQDGCTAPILDTLCYCDSFCNRTRSDDCCPDYWTFCVAGIIAKQECVHNGRIYQYGETVKVNCNECRCDVVDGNPIMNCDQNECLTDPELLKTVMSRGSQYGWAAKNYTQFWGRKYDEGLNLRLGTLHSTKKILQALPLHVVVKKGSLPSSYDIRKEWKDKISEPIDQGWCGASWVISTVQVTADRFSIMSKGTINDILSPQHLLSCYNSRNDGCKGGDVTEAWNWIRYNGLIKEQCYPWEGRKTKCTVSNRKADLIASCPSWTSSSAKTKLRRVGPVYRLARGESIMNEIRHNGPVQAIMTVSKDFFMYESGVYRCSDLSYGSRTGHHSVRIIGWGEEYQNYKLVKYWIASNSWGRDWGENGYFRILKDTNECDIEDLVVAAWANIDDEELYTRRKYSNYRAETNLV
ncbi:Hypothetical protein CINCED_3A024038 [Cinara cedri]|uniref:SMB domain-containing protein n=2 Tax=Cinara cedri TaxID=506608 RepID=A0A5E4NCZ9_9HEMI|nr:Hypothetical protein CINCED_3A024038 [Cinara cedri]